MDNTNDLTFDIGLGDVSWLHSYLTDDAAAHGRCSNSMAAAAISQPNAAHGRCSNSMAAAAISQPNAPLIDEVTAILGPDLLLAQHNTRLSNVDCGAGIGEEQIRLGKSYHGESDASWDEDENEDQWCTTLRSQLREFREGTSWTITTGPLPHRMRKHVHAMANLLGFSHMSIEGKGKKRILISKCPLRSTSISDKQRRWNPPRDNWSTGYIDPRLVMFSVTPGVEAYLLTWLATLSETEPTKITTVWNGTIVFALFANIVHAELVSRTVSNGMPPWDSAFYRDHVSCCFVHFPEGFLLTPAMYDEAFDQLPNELQRFCKETNQMFWTETLLATSSQNLVQPLDAVPSANVRSTACSHSLMRTEVWNQEAELLSPLAAGLELDDAPSELRIAQSIVDSHHSRRPSRRSSQSRDTGYASGYASASSRVDSDYSFATNTSKKRKRERKIENGYTCAFAGCGKLFDHDGDRRKHEKIHYSLRPHVCEICLKGFHYPKDLRRHTKTHSSALRSMDGRLGGFEAVQTIQTELQAGNVDMLDVSDNLDVPGPAVLANFMPWTMNADATLATVLDPYESFVNADASFVNANAVNAIGGENFGGGDEHKHAMGNITDKIAGLLGSVNKVPKRS